MYCVCNKTFIIIIIKCEKVTLNVKKLSLKFNVKNERSTKCEKNVNATCEKL